MESWRQINKNLTVSYLKERTIKRLEEDQTRFNDAEKERIAVEEGLFWNFSRAKQSRLCRKYLQDHMKN